MKTELPCAVVRDLLPSYVEGLTEEETTAAVSSHLETCESCRKHYEAMSAGEKAPKAETKEVDYLKTVRKKNGNRVILAVVLAVVIVLGAVGAKLFIIGSQANGGAVATQITPHPETNSVHVSLANMDSATTFVGLKQETVGGTASITARKVLVSPFRPVEQSINMEIDTTDISKIQVFGDLIWQDGTSIDIMTRRLLDRKIPYVGNAPAVNHLISGMDLDVSNTLELQTAEEPYGVTMHFTDSFAENRRFLVEGNAYVLLALVDNLGEVYWDDPSGYQGSLTLEQANAALPGLVESYNSSHGTDYPVLSSVKDYGKDAYHLQILRNVTGLSFS